MEKIWTRELWGVLTKNQIKWIKFLALKNNCYVEIVIKRGSKRQKLSVGMWMFQQIKIKLNLNRLCFSYQDKNIFFVLLFALCTQTQCRPFFTLHTLPLTICNFFNLPRRKKQIKMEKHYLWKIPLSKVSLHL